jgi:predicted DNA-binding protein with PD1-like motif
MEKGQESNIIVLRMNDGEEILPRLVELAESEGFDSAVVLMGIGMLRDFTLGYYQDGSYKRTEFSAPHELVSLQGSFAIAENEMIVHLHGMLADSEHNGRGGHLFGGIVNGLAELLVMKLTSVKLYRELNEETGLKEMHIRS